MNNKKLLKKLKKIFKKYKEFNNKKTYHDNLHEISKEKLFDGLLGYGLFAEKIPPFLTSEKFLDFCKTPPAGFTFENKPRKFIQYESMRNINVPRILAVPNPIAYRNLCNTLSQNWSMLKKYFKKKTKNNSYKVSRIHVRKIDNVSKIFETCYQELDDIDLSDYPDILPNHLFELNHKNFCTDDYPEPDIIIGKNYMIKADIANCFPSIYSHSIPWALVGKPKSKINQKNTHRWYNQIDEKTRNLKEAETHGILIGPHASNVTSEIVLVAVDEKISQKYDYVRNIDDYTCYVRTHEESEQFLIDLSTELKKFNLLLNHKKTEILKLPLASNEHWIRKIRSFVFPSDDEKLKLNEVRAFLDIALELMKENQENSAILNYAIKVLSKKSMTKNAKAYFIKTIHHLVLIYPYLVPLLDEKVFSVFRIDKDVIEKIAKDIFKIGNEKKLYEAMSYALYFGIKYNFKVHDDLFDVIDNNRDTILMTLAYLHDEKFIRHSAVRKKYKDLASELKDDIDEYWVFVYEVLTVGLLENEWNVMKSNSVSFIQDEFK